MWLDERWNHSFKSSTPSLIPSVQILVSLSLVHVNLSLFSISPSMQDSLSSICKVHASCRHIMFGISSYGIHSQHHLHLRWHQTLLWDLLLPFVYGEKWSISQWSDMTHPPHLHRCPNHSQLYRWHSTIFDCNPLLRHSNLFWYVWMPRHPSLYRVQICEEPSLPQDCLSASWWYRDSISQKAFRLSETSVSSVLVTCMQVASATLDILTRPCTFCPNQHQQLCIISAVVWVIC